jgi:hypothetical protein
MICRYGKVTFLCVVTDRPVAYDNEAWFVIYIVSG